jgi:hypothetical protein
LTPRGTLPDPLRLVVMAAASEDRGRSFKSL